VAAVVIVWGRILPKQAAVLAAGASALSVGCAAWLLDSDVRGVSTLWSWAPELHLEVSWRLEIATLALAILVAGIGLLVLQYAGRYFEGSRQNGQIIALLAAFESAMLGLVLADNVLLLYVFWELTGLCSFFLIKSDKSKGDSGLRAASQALLVTVAGGLSMLIGMLYLIARSGTASLSAWLTLDLDPATQGLVLALILPAVLTKSAQIPTHFWLPGAMAAPTPVSAYLHSATMVKAGLVLLLYLYPLLGGSPLWTWVLLPLGAVTCVWGSLRALGESDIKLLMAWSTVSQLGLITLTIGLGTDVAIRAAILHLFAHAVFKAGLFLSVGGVDHAAHTRSLLELGGLRRRIPLLAAVAAVLAGSMAGIPPLAGFLSKELILKKAMMADLWMHSLAISAIILGSIGTVAYSSRFFFEVFTGQARSEKAASTSRLPFGLVLAPLSLAAVTLLSGPAAPWVDRWFLEPVAFSFVGHPLEVKSLSLWYGVNAALLLSLVIVSTGYLADRWLGLRFLGRRGVHWWHGSELFEAFMEQCQRAGQRIVRVLAGASPRVYLGIAVACGLLPGLILVPNMTDVDWSSAPPVGTGIVLVLMVLLAFLLAARRPLPRVLILTAIGFAVAILFRMSNGPDLMLTQLLVEVLVTIFFALALWALPRGLPREPTGRAVRKRWLRGMLAVAAGLGAAAWVAALATTTSDTGVADYVRESAPEIAKGKNLVNVVLADVRSLDTLMETVVVLLGTLGVVGVLKGSERTVGGLGSSLGSSAPGTASSPGGLLPGLSRIILPIGLLFSLVMLVKGHNSPGGGFVAGLALGVTAMIGMAALGPYRFGRRLRVSLSGSAILGCGLMLASGGIGWLTGRPYLTHLHGALTIGELYVPLHTTMIFDLGVMLAVAGGVGAAGMALWATAEANEGGEPE
jgi:NADH:ubiquinone oxidoreductase subunit 5 (subunit L)/multisubunit Na+/H+ antiporter MnhA subunit/multisubunit Na+/H+ antiporter MnhB subunit